MRDWKEKIGQIQIWPPSLLAISSFKGGLAITLGTTLAFVPGFQRLSPNGDPAALTWTVLACILGCAGRPVGACLVDCFLSLLGLAYGCLFFACLGFLGEQQSHVGQAFVFAFLCYFAALVRFSGAKYIPFYLPAILFSFQGIFVTIRYNSTHWKTWLLAYFEAYAWGIAICMSVNLIVLPISAESQLLFLLTNTVERVSTLAHLTCKTYGREIMTDERDVRELLINLIRQDFSALSARLDEASYEIVYSRWSTSDLRKIITAVRALTQALITSSSALNFMEDLDTGSGTLNKYLLAREENTATFIDFRYGIDLVIATVLDEVNGVAPIEFEDLEEQAHQFPIPGRTISRQPSVYSTKHATTIAARLRAEVRHNRNRHRLLKIHSHTVPTTPTDSSNATPRSKPTNDSQISSQVSPMVQFLKRSWSRFDEAQKKSISDLIKDESLLVEDKLHVTNGLPSLQEMYHDRLPSGWTSALLDKDSIPGFYKRSLGEMSQEPTTPSDTPCSEALTKSYSLLFGLGRFTEELTTLFSLVSTSHSKRLRFRFLNLQRFPFFASHEQDMSLKEALDALQGQEYSVPSVHWAARVMKMEAWLRSDRSLYALKVAFGASIHALLLLASTTREFYLQYGLSSSLITIIVAISPSLGQTFMTFILQLSGTGIGSVYSAIILYIFRNVSGYPHHPVGLAVFLLIWSVGVSYPFYKYPKWYTGTLLALNSAGTSFMTAWLTSEKRTESIKYENAGLRMGHALASMCVSWVIAAVIQMLIFRVPARKKLRENIGAVTFALSSYNTILQSLINAVVPAEKKAPPATSALMRIERELIKRETKIQADLIALQPLFEFASIEPQFVTPFPGPLIQSIISIHQVLLDRLREARTAVGITGFSEPIHRDFASIVYPYRLHSQRLARTLFYLSATSLISKTPLPRDAPRSNETWKEFEHDELVLARRLASVQERQGELHDPAFLRYWFYLAAMRSVSTELENLEEYLEDLFGIPEQTNPHLA